jgi:hypothetical protein
MRNPRFPDYWTAGVKWYAHDRGIPMQFGSAAHCKSKAAAEALAGRWLTDVPAYQEAIERTQWLPFAWLRWIARRWLTRNLFQ